ncbi:MAG: tryptophan synthase subunit alpha [Spirochaetaceae bacterium]|nr:tryptophan synthase subunit alpha [Spirochaetaceae bacterium]
MSERQGACIMTHLVASFPSWEASLEVGKGLVDGGAAYLEVQFPFSDPTADGPHIQVACDEALAAGFTQARGFALVEELRKYSAVPVAVMSYANPIFQNGVARFVQRCRDAGADAVIAPDLPPDYDEGLYAAGRDAGVAVIPVVVPSTLPERLRTVVTGADTDLVYAALRKGITGSYTEIGADNLAFLRCIGELGGKPMAGFGIRTGAQVAALTPHVEYVVVGTWFVELLRRERRADPRALMSRAMAELLV